MVKDQEIMKKSKGKCSIQLGYEGLKRNSVIFKYLKDYV